MTQLTIPPFVLTFKVIYQPMSPNLLNKKTMEAYKQVGTGEKAAEKWKLRQWSMAGVATQTDPFPPPDSPKPIWRSHPVPTTPPPQPTYSEGV